MQTSTRAAIRYPDSFDTPNIPQHIQNMATDLDTMVIPKFASAGLRDAAIPSPTDGQHCYLTNLEQFQQYNTGYGQWLPFYQSVFKIKTANETLGNTTTFQNDDHLAGYALKASTTYLMRGVVMVTSPAAADIKFIWNWSVSPTAGQWCIKGTETANSIGARVALMTGQIAPPTQGAPAVEFMTFEGYVLTAVTPTTVTLQWAKNTGDATNSFLFGGSWVEFVEAS